MSLNLQKIKINESCILEINHGCHDILSFLYIAGFDCQYFVKEFYMYIHGNSYMYFSLIYNVFAGFGIRVKLAS